MLHDSTNVRLHVVLVSGTSQVRHWCCCGAGCVVLQVDEDSLGEYEVLDALPG